MLGSLGKKEEEGLTIVFVPKLYIRFVFCP
jgi:hypothetical protein